MRDWRKQQDDALVRFLADAAEHKMTVAHDDGLYRHLRFRAPGTGFYWFDLVTWPGHLSITGDMGSFTFARVQDMFQFFRVGAGINPGYWGEKLVAKSHYKDYSEDVFREWVADQVKYAQDAHPERDWDEINEALGNEVLEAASFEHDAVEAIQYWNDVDGKSLGFTFSTDDWPQLHDYTHQYLWCCHAIRWGIGHYDAYDAAVRP